MFDWSVGRGWLVPSRARGIKLEEHIIVEAHHCSSKYLTAERAPALQGDRPHLTPHAARYRLAASHQSRPRRRGCLGQEAMTG